MCVIRNIQLDYKRVQVKIMSPSHTTKQYKFIRIFGVGRIGPSSDYRFCDPN
jgi:hypothetical protein